MTVASRRTRWTVAAGIGLAALLCALYGAWDPGPSSGACFDTGNNGLWIGHRWFTGRDEKTGRPLSLEEIDRIAATIRTNRIRHVYVHAGTVDGSATIADTPGTAICRLRESTPGVFFLPWLSGRTAELPLRDPAWRARLVRTIARLHALGFPGVHLDFEPIRDHHPGYVDLLSDIRRAFDRPFVLSHATRRAMPFGWSLPLVSRYCWSGGFYRETMRLADQTVLMGYDTGIRAAKFYTAWIRHQTRLLLSWAASVPGHRVMIGVPSYGGTIRCDGRVENIRTAALGVRAACAARPGLARTLDGIAVYAEWTTDRAEWEAFRVFWLSGL